MNYCGQCGVAVGQGNRFCGSCGAPVAPASSPTAPPPSAPAPTPSYQPVYSPQVSQKSSGIAILLTILIPGLGHMYLGLTRKGTPYLIINVVLLALSLLLFVFWPIAIIAWIVTLVMTVTHISDETAMVNDALLNGVPISTLDK